MKILLNLLPEEKKKEIQKRKVIKLVIWQEVLIILSIVFFISIAYGSNLALKIQLGGLEKASLEEENLGGYNRVKEYEKEFQEINEKVSFIAKIQENHFHWQVILAEFNELVTNEIELDDLISNDYEIIVNGKARTRESLVALQERVTSSECFFDVQVPLSDIVVREDIDFQLSFSINRDCLKDK